LPILVLSPTQSNNDSELYEQILALFFEHGLSIDQLMYLDYRQPDDAIDPMSAFIKIAIFKNNVRLLKYLATRGTNFGALRIRNGDTKWMNVLDYANSQGRNEAATFLLSQGLSAEILRSHPGKWYFATGCYNSCWGDAGCYCSDKWMWSCCKGSNEHHLGCQQAWKCDECSSVNDFEDNFCATCKNTQPGSGALVSRYNGSYYCTFMVKSIGQGVLTSVHPLPLYLTSSAYLKHQHGTKYFECSMCGQSSGTISHHCPVTQFDACPECFQKATQPEDIEMANKPAFVNVYFECRGDNSLGPLQHPKDSDLTYDGISAQPVEVVLEAQNPACSYSGCLKFEDSFPAGAILSFKYGSGGYSRCKFVKPHLASQ